MAGTEPTRYQVRKQGSDPVNPWGVYSEWSAGQSISDFPSQPEALDYARLLVFLGSTVRETIAKPMPLPPPRRSLALWFFGHRK